MKPLDVIPSLAERVYNAILDDILDGALVPGQHLVQEQLALDLGVSRQPIQQAMALLKADGLVEETGKRGLTVAKLDLTRMRHHYDIRAVLDGYGARAAALAVKTGTTDVRMLEVRAQSILKAGTAAVAKGSVRDQIRQDEALHKLIYAFSGNPVLDETTNLNWSFLRRAMADVLRYAEPPESIWDQHRAIIGAILSGDPDAAEALAADHVRVAAGLLCEAFEERVGKMEALSVVAV